MTEWALVSRAQLLVSLTLVIQDCMVQDCLTVCYNKLDEMWFISHKRKELYGNLLGTAKKIFFVILIIVLVLTCSKTKINI